MLVLNNYQPKTDTVYLIKNLVINTIQPKIIF